jgi:hypothetical protein
MRDIKFDFNNSKIDTISKFNFYDKSFLKNLESLVIFSKVSVNDQNFLRDFFFISKMLHAWFGRKISILRVISDKKRGFNKGKNSLIFFFGCTLRKKYIPKNSDYINNIIFNLTKKVDGSIKYKKISKGFVYSFSNVNFLLGFKSERFFNLNLKINIFYNFFSSEKKSLKLKEINDKAIMNFYEKVFF